MTRSGPKAVTSGLLRWRRTATGLARPRSPGSYFGVERQDVQFGDPRQKLLHPVFPPSASEKMSASRTALCIGRPEDAFLAAGHDALHHLVYQVRVGPPQATTVAPTVADAGWPRSRATASSCTTRSMSRCRGRGDERWGSAAGGFMPVRCMGGLSGARTAITGRDLKGEHSPGRVRCHRHMLSCSSRYRQFRKKLGPCAQFDVEELK